MEPSYTELQSRMASRIPTSFLTGKSPWTTSFYASHFYTHFPFDLYDVLTVLCKHLCRNGLLCRIRSLCTTLHSKSSVSRYAAVQYYVKYYIVFECTSRIRLETPTHTAHNLQCLTIYVALTVNVNVMAVAAGGDFNVVLPVVTLVLAVGTSTGDAWLATLARWRAPAHVLHVLVAHRNLYVRGLGPQT